jgi:hypothetical protein
VLRNIILNDWHTDPKFVNTAQRDAWKGAGRGLALITAIVPKRTLASIVIRRLAAPPNKREGPKRLDD